MVSAEGLGVTTSIRSAGGLEALAQHLAQELHCVYIPREGHGMAPLCAAYFKDRLLIAGTNRFSLYDASSDQEYVFHPNMVPVRANSDQRGARDLFLEAAQLESGQRLLDCTLGFGAEATLAALAVGETGAVIGLESVPELAVLTREGLKSFPMAQKDVAQAMRRVEVVARDYRIYLPACPDDSYDVVYFDPFFPEHLSGAGSTLGLLACFGNTAPLDENALLEAQRAARRVVVKHPKYEPLMKNIAEQVTSVVSSRRSRLAYSVIERGKQASRDADHCVPDNLLRTILPIRSGPQS